jgi:Na+/proline symporter/signal transduction histidine kinase
MFNIWQAIVLLAVYALVQYAIARWAQSPSALSKKVRQSATIYSLSLAVFCTSWTYYGNIGQASGQGIQHLALYLGSSLAFVFLIPTFKKMVRIKAHFHTTSIADFISTRYNHSQWLAALISLLCLVGITPYISIQLKSIISSAQLFIISSNSTNDFLLAQFDILIVLLMTAFTIAFGVRKLDPTERHPGMMVALAAESLFKLLAFLAAGIFICFFVFNDFGELLTIASEQFGNTSSLDTFSQVPSISSWLTTLALGMIGVIALPRQFHVGIIECSDEKVLNHARWMFPLYLFIINFLVIPIAIAGQILLPTTDNPDLILLNIPILQDSTFISILVFLGGFAAATGMIMVSAMTLSTMATNHLLLPVIEKINALHFLRRKLLYIRWFMVAFILFSGLYYYRIIGDSELIVRIGSISFVAIAQLIPALLIGLFWQKGNNLAAITGIASGTVIWYYTLMLPSVINSGWFETDLLINGPFNLAWLKPEHLFYLQIDSSVGHSLFWSLSINCALFIIISEKTFKTGLSADAITFINIANGKQHSIHHKKLIADICLANKLQILTDLINNYLPNTETKRKLELCCKLCEVDPHNDVNVIQLSQLRNKATSMLAGIIGMAAANRAIKSIELLNKQEQALLSNSYSDVLAQSLMSPDELLEKVDFYQEKQQLLEEHADLQLKAMGKLADEHQQTIKAKFELDQLNQQLENRIEERTSDLKNTNQELTSAMSELKLAQKKLFEADKMASLGRVVAGVAHEINTPIGVILTAMSSLKDELDTMYLQIKENKISKNSLEEFMNYSTEVCQLSLTNIQRAAHLIDSFKQVAVDQEKESIESLLVGSCIENSLLNIKSRFKDKVITYNIDCDMGLEIMSYQSAFMQIITHLATNSCLHGFEHQAEGVINIRCYERDDQLIIKYNDNGKGLTEDGKKNIFEPFYTTNRGKGGSGLGSHLIYNLVTQLLQGEIIIDPEAVQGLGFIINFPLEKESAK